MIRFIPVFVSLVAISTATAQQVAVQPVANGTHPVVSPDGRHIAISSKRDGTSDLYVINEDGSGVVRLTRSEESEGIVGWSADGARVMFSVFRNDTSHLFSVGRDGSGLTEIGRNSGRASRISGDGATVVYGAGPWGTMQLFVAPLDGSNPKQVTPGTSAYWCHSLSADGKRIAVGRTDSGGIQIWVLNADGSGARQVTHFPREEGSPQCPSWSPDGRRVAVQSAAPDPQDPKKQAGHIWVVDVATGAATKLAAHREPYLDETPSWFPDGKRLAFQSDRTGRWEVWVMNADGTGAKQVTR